MIPPVRDIKEDTSGRDRIIEIRESDGLCRGFIDWCAAHQDATFKITMKIEDECCQNIVAGKVYPINLDRAAAGKCVRRAYESLGENFGHLFMTEVEKQFDVKAGIRLDTGNFDVRTIRRLRFFS